MRCLIGDNQHSQRSSNIYVHWADRQIITNRKMENLDLLSYVAEVYKVAWQTTLEIACHLKVYSLATALL